MMQIPRIKWGVFIGLITIPACVGLVHAMNDDSSVDPPIFVGTPDKGALNTDLYRGASVPDELLVIETPGNCQVAFPTDGPTTSKPRLPI